MLDLFLEFIFKFNYRDLSRSCESSYVFGIVSCDRVEWLV